MHAALSLLSSDFGSPHGVTTNSKWSSQLWQWSYYFAIPIGLLVVGLIAWSLVRYRHREGSGREPAQFQYHIPIEFAYTVAPLVVVAVIFGLMFNAENKADKVANPSDPNVVKIEVQGFQWGWRFVYPNGHSQVGTADYSNINDNQGLPVLYMPANTTVQLHVVSLDVVHTFYVPEFLFNRDLIPGVNNVFDLNITKPGLYPGQCNNICGQYHAYMRFLVDVMSPDQYKAWYANQPACSITTAGQGDTPVPGKCSDQTTYQPANS
jgi:cytochrome c oxidase subunit 2